LPSELYTDDLERLVYYATSTGGRNRS